MSRSTSVRAASPAGGKVSIDIADVRLATELANALRDAALADADVSITDRGAGDRVVVSTAAGSSVALTEHDPTMILAAVTLLKAGYSIRRDPMVGDALVSSVHLSPREQQVAALLLEGASNKAIARVLGISVHTAKFHVTAVLDKLGARNRADAVSIILREGLIAL